MQIRKIIEDVSHKAEAEKLKSVIDELQRFALYDDLTGLYSKTVPVADECHKRVNKF